MSHSPNILSMYLFILFVIRILLVTAYNCYHAYQCMNDELAIYGALLSYGYKSNSGSNASITMMATNTVYCRGAFSCSKIAFVNSSGRINCDGSNSCSNVSGSPLSLLETSSSVSCEGSNSCIYSNIKGKLFVSCYGDQSCSYANITGSVEIYINGAYALYRGIIDSHGAGSTVSAYFQGHYSGFGATLICRENDICTINCFGNSCYMLHLDCRGTNNCIIDLKGNNRDCDPITDINIFNLKLANSQFSLLYDSSLNSINNDISCNQPPSRSYDHNQGAMSDIINQGAICCRGEDSCSHPNKIEINTATETTNSIICSGTFSCMDVGTINNSNGPIYGEGMQALWDSNIITTENVYCLGWGTCIGSNISNAQNVFCGGMQSCQSAKIQSEGDLNVYLFGRSSGSDTKIYCNENDKCLIYCGGYNSCRTTQVFCNRCTSHTMIGLYNDYSFWCHPLHPMTANSTTAPITNQPTTINPTSSNPTTINPTNSPITIKPITKYPTTAQPTTDEPTTNEPTTQNPTSSPPATSQLTKYLTTQKLTTGVPIISISESTANDSNVNGDNDEKKNKIAVIITSVCVAVLCLIICGLFGFYHFIRRKKKQNMRSNFELIQNSTELTNNLN